MKTLQIGAPHSGNLWLWNIIQRIRERSELSNESLVRDHAIHEVARELDLSDGRLADVDMLHVDRLGLSWRISSVFRMPIEDIDAYAAQCDHVLTESSFCERTPLVLSKFDKVVYLVRDPRDRLLAAARSAFGPRAEKYWPHGEEDPVSFVENRFDASMDAWKWHVHQYTSHGEVYDIHMVLYERLLYDLEGEVERLVDYLEVDLDPVEQHKICEEVRAEVEGKKTNQAALTEPGLWHTRLDRRQKGRAVVLCGPMLDLFDYPRYRPLSRESLPAPPELLDTSQFEEATLPR